MKKFNAYSLWIVGVMGALYLAAVVFRPLLPIDETRYMTVAWEMKLHEGWLAPLTLNFEPYHHKPPMLFWLINIFWQIFGISRWAGLIPIVLSSIAVIFLTIRIGQKILPQSSYNPTRIALLFLGSVPFLAYGTLVMFDLTLTVFVLCAFLCLLNYAQERKFRSLILMGLFTGLGVLTKGPVVFLYLIFPILFAPLWVRNFSRPVSWYADCLAGLLISIFPVALWLVPVLSQSDNHFAFWLLWEQTAGRVTGNFSDAHVRPFYFYLPFIPLLFAPWVFFPSFTGYIRSLTKESLPQELRFIAAWILPTFMAFSFISGKQPHYLLPLLPAVILFCSIALSQVSIEKIRNISAMLVGVLIIGQGIASVTVFKDYDLLPVAQYVRQHQNHDWAFVRNYHGEIGFLGKIENGIADLQPEQLENWFKTHPDGMAIVRYNTLEEVENYSKIFSQDYRGKNIGIFSQ